MLLEEREDALFQHVDGRDRELGDVEVAPGTAAEGIEHGRYSNTLSKIEVIVANRRLSCQRGQTGRPRHRLSFHDALGIVHKFSAVCGMF